MRGRGWSSYLHAAEEVEDGRSVEMGGEGGWWWW